MSTMASNLFDNATEWHFDPSSSYDQLSQYLARATAPNLVLIFSIVASVFVLSLNWLKHSPYPLFNGKNTFEFSTKRPKKNFITNGWQILSAGLRKAPDGIFRVIGDVGEIHILPPKYAYEIRNHNDFSFTQAAYKVSLSQDCLLGKLLAKRVKWYYGHLPGFEGFREGTNESNIMKLVARHQLTHQLTLVTKPVSDETATALSDILTESRGKKL